MFNCSFPGCNRGPGNGFTRSDHLNNHIRRRHHRCLTTQANSSVSQATGQSSCYNINSNHDLLNNTTVPIWNLNIMPSNSGLPLPSDTPMDISNTSQSDELNINPRNLEINTGSSLFLNNTQSCSVVDLAIMQELLAAYNPTGREGRAMNFGDGRC